MNGNLPALQKQLSFAFHFLVGNFRGDLFPHLSHFLLNEGVGVGKNFDFRLFQLFLFKLLDFRVNFITLLFRVFIDRF